MIQEGDGVFRDRMRKGLCPSCQTGMKYIRDTFHKVEYYCTTCKLRIIDVKHEGREPSE